MVNQKSATVKKGRLNDYIDLDRYPIHDLDSNAGQALIAQAHEMMDGDTLCLLEGFLRESAVSELSAEITQLESKAHRIDHLCTIYGWMNNAGFPPEHPRVRRQSLRQIKNGKVCSLVTTVTRAWYSRKKLVEDLRQVHRNRISER